MMKVQGGEKALGEQCWLGADFGVDEFFAFVVSQDDFLLIARDHVVGIEGNLAAAAGSIEDVLRKGVASGVAAKAFDEVETSLDRGAQV